MKKSFAVVTNPTYNPPKKVVEDPIKAFRKIMTKRKEKEGGGAGGWCCG